MRHMDIHDFFENPAVALPRVRPDTDFEQFLRRTLNAYLGAVDGLDAGCHLCDAIRARKQQITETARWVCGAVQKYLEGSPSEAYAAIEHGLNGIDQNISSLFTNPVPDDDVRPLFRMVKSSTGAVDRARLFHCPMDLRHRVGQHRYGIPGFPCLYLGGSLEVCQHEARIQDSDLSQVSVAEFELRSPARLLNFAYRPSVLSQVAGGSALRPSGANPLLERFLVDYATCWPLMAAASLRVLHDSAPFIHEYIVPQMILQWIMKTTDCDGIRYFSTRWCPSSDAIKATTNYVFPAKRPWNGQNRSQPLMNKFNLTDPVLWNSTTGGTDLARERRDNAQVLAGMPKTPM
jgi:hypothetical protein